MGLASPAIAKRRGTESKLCFLASFKRRPIADGSFRYLERVKGIEPSS
jgi:hypothetical protein